MTPVIIDISPWQLALTLLFVLTAQAISLFHRLELVRDLTMGTLRTFIQLTLMGYVLTYIFRVHVWWISIAVFLVMIITAGHIIRSRIRERQVRFFFPMLLAMIGSYLLVSVTVTGVIVGARPWWQPQYFIPLAGMIIGNSMGAITISLERLFSDLRGHRDQVEMKLALGAEYHEASREIVRDAMQAGMIPSINAMMGVGIVFIPGMMTGQILAGVDPLIAIRYQIVVMLMLVAATALGTFIIILLVRRRCFGKDHRLLLRHR